MINKSIRHLNEVVSSEELSSLYVDCSNTEVGRDLEVIVYTPVEVDGVVRLEVDGVQFTGSIDTTLHKANFSISGLPAGVKTLSIECDGYNTTEQVEIVKVTATLKATTKDIKQGADEVITVTTPSDAIGIVRAVLNGDTYTANIINGKAKVVISDLFAGKYSADIYYDGDDKYYPTEEPCISTFTVSKSKAPIG